MNKEIFSIKLKNDNANQVYQLLLILILLLSTVACGGGGDSSGLSDPNNPFVISTSDSINSNNQPKIGNDTATNSIPQNIAITAKDESLLVSWDKVKEAKSYNLYYSESENIALGQANRITGINSESYTLKGLKNNTKYFIIVTAVNENGESESSSVKNETPTPLVVLTAPQNLSATTTNDQVMLSWDATPLATSYSIYFSTSTGTNTNDTKLSTVTTASYTHQSLSSGKTYYYIVITHNSTGQSNASNEVNATPTFSTTAPNNPSNLVATNGNEKLTISWDTSTGADSYKLYYKNTSGVSTAGTVVYTGSGNSYLHEGLINGNTYYYMVTAVNFAGESSGSNEASGMPTVPLSVPNAPQNVISTAGNTQVNLTWDTVASATSYKIYYDTNSNFNLSGNLSTSVSGNTYTQTNLSNGTLYYFVVTAVNGAGESVGSNEASGMPTVPLSVPNAPQNIISTAGNTQVNLTWDTVASATSYKIYYDTNSNFNLSGNLSTSVSGNTYTQTNLSNGTLYYFVVTAVNGAGESVGSNEASGMPTVPLSVPNAPQDVISTAGNTQVNLTWDTVASATSYKIYYDTNSNFNLSGNLSASVSGNTYTQTNLSNGTPYYFVVTAVNGAGESVGSNETSATPVAPLSTPNAPNNLSAIATNNQVMLAWDTVVSATSYKIYYDTNSNFNLSGNLSASVSGNTYTQTNLSNGTPYYFVVTAVNGAGESVGSNEASATPVAPLSTPNAPNNLSASTSGNQTINLTWDTVANADTYKIYSFTTSGFSTGGNQIGSSNINSFNHEGLTNGTAYYYIVTAMNAQGESSEPGEVSATPLAAPTPKIVSSGDGKITISWDNVTGATNYSIYYATSANVTTSSSTKPNVTSPESLSGLTDDTGYYIAMTANNASGSSSLSSEISHTISGNLVAWWTFDENSGTVANDSSSQVNHGTLTNGPLWTSGNVNSAVSFDGVDDYIEVADLDAYDFGTDDFSLTAWIKTPHSGPLHFLTRINNNSNQWRLGIDGANVIRFNDIVSGNAIYGDINLSDNVWHHIVAVRNSGNINLYIDGKHDGYGIASGNLSGTGPLKIGTVYSGNKSWNGLLDEIRIYNKALSLNEVISIYGSDVAAWSPSGITPALWIDASDNTTITSDASGNISQWNDKSGNGYHLSQGNTVLQPNINSTAINGNNTISFDDHVMSTTGNPFGALIEDAHVFQVFRTGSTLVKGTNFNLIDNSAADSRYSSHAPYFNGRLIYDPGDVALRLAVDNWATTNEIILGSFNSSTSGNTREVWKNGTLSISGDSPESQAVIGGIVVGANSTANNKIGQKFELAEMIVINGTLKQLEKQKIEGYLAHKWGLENKLPSDHPYKQNAP